MSRYHAGQRRHATDDADLDAIEDAYADLDDVYVGDLEAQLCADRFGPTLPLQVEGVAG